MALCSSNGELLNSPRPRIEKRRKRRLVSGLGTRLPLPRLHQEDEGPEAWIPNSRNPKRRKGWLDAP